MDRRGTRRQRQGGHRVEGHIMNYHTLTHRNPPDWVWIMWWLYTCIQQFLHCGHVTQYKHEMRRVGWDRKTRGHSLSKLCIQNGTSLSAAKSAAQTSVLLISILIETFITFNIHECSLVQNYYSSLLLRRSVLFLLFCIEKKSAHLASDCC